MLLAFSTVQITGRPCHPIDPKQSYTDDGLQKSGNSCNAFWFRYDCKICPGHKFPQKFANLQKFAFGHKFARISPNLPENVCTNFRQQRSWRPCFGMNSKIKKRTSCAFLQKLGALVVLNQTTLGAIFAPTFRDFAQIFGKSKLLGVRLHTHLQHWLQTTRCPAPLSTRIKMKYNNMYVKQIVVVWEKDQSIFHSNSINRRH